MKFTVLWYRIGTAEEEKKNQKYFYVYHVLFYLIFASITRKKRAALFFFFLELLVGTLENFAGTSVYLLLEGRLEGNLDILGIIWESGLVVKSVLLLLIGFSILSWAIIFKKYAHLRIIRKENVDFLTRFQQSDSVAELVTATEDLKQSLYRDIFVEGYRELEKIRGGNTDKTYLKNYLSEFGLDSIKRAMKKGVHRNNLKLNALLSTLASIGPISPFVGLFGTVWGIINSFTGLASGGGTLDAVAPGIAEALVATAVGLAAAIPAVWFYNDFSNQNSEFGIEMEIFEQEFLNIVERSALN